MNTVSNKFKVCVKCFTYNHAPFIEQAMNGFVMQETQFPFVCIIVDDGSSDGEPQVILDFLGKHFDYPETGAVPSEENDDYLLYFAQSKDNPQCFFAVYLLKYNHYSIKKPKRLYLTNWNNCTYEAYCEGDDYWIDNKKLQKQVEILDNNPQYALCHHNMYYETNGSRDVRTIDIPNTQTLAELAKENFIQTATVLFRIPSYPIIPDTFNGKHIYMHFIFLRVCEQGDVYYMDDPMSVYRFHPGGMYSEKTLFEQFRMTADNISLMASWYKGKNKDVMKALQHRLNDSFLQHVKASIKRFGLLDTYRIIKLYNKNRIRL